MLQKKNLRCSMLCIHEQAIIEDSMTISICPLACATSQLKTGSYSRKEDSQSSLTPCPDGQNLMGSPMAAAQAIELIPMFGLRIVLPNSNLKQVAKLLTHLY